MLADSWFASEANLELVHRELKNTVVSALKGNRLAVRREQERRTTPWTRIEDLVLEEDRPCAVWLRGLDFPWPCCATATETWMAAGWTCTS